MSMRERMNPSVLSASASMIRLFSQKAAQTPGCLALTLGEPDFDTPRPVCDEIAVSLAHHETHYIPNAGTAELREAIALWERKKHGYDYTASEIIVTSGASEALFIALLGILSPGDEVLIPAPAFVLYKEAVKMLGAKPVMMDTEEDGYQIRRKNLSSHMGPRTKAVILNSPNNPTGVILDAESLEAVREAVKGKGIFVITDDVYGQIVHGGEYHSFAEYRDLREQILVVESFSKPWAMTGWRMGWLMGDASVMERLVLVHQYAVVSTPSLFQRSAIRALSVEPKALVSAYAARRNVVLSALSAMGLPVPPMQGAFYAFPSIREFGLSSEDFCSRLLEEEKLAVTPGSCFDGEGHIRLSYCYNEDVLKECLSRLSRFIGRRRTVCRQTGLPKQTI